MVRLSLFKKNILIFLVFILLIACTPFKAQDFIVPQAKTNNQYFDVQRNIAWVAANRVFIFNTRNTDQAYCVYIANNNPTNAHTLTLTTYQTADGQVADFSNNQNRWITTNYQGTVASIPASTMGAAFVSSRAAARVAIQLSNITALAGSPDTVDILVVQTTMGSCGAVNASTGQLFNLSSPNSGTSATSSIQIISDTLSTGFEALITCGFTGTAHFCGNVWNPSSTKTIYFDHIYLNSTTTAIYFLDFVTSTGTCPGGTAFNLKAGNATASITQLATGLCTVDPTFSGFQIELFLTANTPLVLDLRGVILPAGSNNGLSISGPAATTTLTYSPFWYEKSGQ